MSRTKMEMLFLGMERNEIPVVRMIDGRRREQ